MKKIRMPNLLKIAPSYWWHPESLSIERAKIIREWLDRVIKWREQQK